MKRKIDPGKLLYEVRQESFKIRGLGFLLGHFEPERYQHSKDVDAALEGLSLILREAAQRIESMTYQLEEGGSHDEDPEEAA